MKRTWLWKACPFYIFSLHHAIKKEHLQSLLVSACVCAVRRNWGTSICLRSSQTNLQCTSLLLSHTEPSAIPVQCKCPPQPADTGSALYSFFIQTHKPASYHFGLSGKTVFVLSLLRQITPKHPVPCIILMVSALLRDSSQLQHDCCGVLSRKKKKCC